MKPIRTPESTSVPINNIISQDANLNHTKDTDDPFLPPTPSLLITSSMINKTNARILIDTGAVLDYIDSTFCEKSNIFTETTNHVARMANKSLQTLTMTKEPIEIQIKGYTEKRKFAVCPLDYDVILGKRWTTEKKCFIDCERNIVQFRHRDNEYTIEALEPTIVHHISANTITKDERRQYPIYAIFVRQGEEEVRLENRNKYPPAIEKLLRRYKDVFPDTLPPGPPPKRNCEFHIKLHEEATPQKKGIYRMSAKETEEMRKQLAELTNQGFIRPSVSPWGSPTLFVTKKDGTLRMCVDYRALNRLTVKNSYPLPRIDDILDQVGNAKYFTKIDLRQGYHQIRMNEKSIPLTAFRTKFGHYEYTVLPFGLTNAPATFMTLMNNVLREYLNKFVAVYLDDILVYSETLEDHVKHLESILKKLQEHKLYAKLSKCTFAVAEVEYLGHIIGSKGVRMDPNKTKAIKDWPTPRNKKDVQSFLGLLNYYRRFIRSCSAKAKPLTELTKNVPFIWKEETQKAFESLKRTISEAPVLKTFDPKLPIIVTTDASKIAIGAVLEQLAPEGKVPVAFYSRTLNQCERNYAPHELELLAIVDTLRAWRVYLHGNHFTVHTDHYPLRYLETQESLSGRQVRWLERLVNFDFNIIPIKGKSNVVADALSRQTNEPQDEEGYNHTLLNQALRITNNINAISFVEPDQESLDLLVREYSTDPEFSQIHKNPRAPFEKRNSLLYFDEKLCVPKGLYRSMLLHDHHCTPSSGHLGVKKTNLRITPNYHWKSIRKDIKSYVKSCLVCQRTKALNQKPYGLLQPLEPPKNKWTHLTMDFITPLPKSKNGHTGILVVVDRLSKMIRLIPLPEKVDAPLVAKLFKDHIYRNHGLPQVIISDRDSIFMSNFWKALFTLLGTKISPSSAYHPQTDGQTEIVNRKTEEMIRAFVNFDKSNWDDNLIDFEVAYNSSVHATTSFTPYFMNYGIHPRTIPIQTLSSDVPAADSFIEKIQNATKQAINEIRNQNEAAARYANRFRSPHKFEVGDKVLLSTKNLSLEDGSGSRKLNPKYIGPFRILEKVNEVTVKLELSQPMIDRGIHNAFHVSLLREFHDDKFEREKPPPPAIEFDDGHVEYEVERILNHKRKRGKIQYLVKWLGYADHENSWLLEKDLKNSPELLKTYKHERKLSI